MHPHVLVSGAGPTGLTVANLLADYGVSVTVLERAPGPGDEPRAVALVDESARTLAALGLLDELSPDVLWNSEVRYFGAGGRLLATARPPREVLGHPAKALFDQPALERVLYEGARRRPLITLEYGTALAALDQDADGVTVRTDTGRTIGADYLVACDGGRSTVRDLVRVPMCGSSQTEPWIVLDVLNDPHTQRAALFHCDPRRPTVVIPGQRGRCRYEFMLLPDEDREAVLEHDFLQRLIAPYRLRPLHPEDVRRKAVYVAHRLVADRWRAGRVFLAGDAAHMMPPFAGQGLNSGMRDARNLAWKLAAVLRAGAPEALLDTYESERRPHSAAMVRVSVRLGRQIMATSPLHALVRDTAARATRIVPALHRYLADMRFLPAPRFTQGCLASPPGKRPAPAGTPLPQPDCWAPDGTRVPLDSLLGPGWAVVALAREHDPAVLQAVAKSPLVRLAPRLLTVLPADHAPHSSTDSLVVAETESLLPFGPEATPPRLLLVRPDRYIAAVFAPGQEALVATLLDRWTGTDWPADWAGPGQHAE